MSTNVAIVYHSGYGHTAVVAEHVAKGAREVPGVEASLYKAEDLSNPDKGPWDQLAAADAIIFGAPTYMDQLRRSLSNLPMPPPRFGSAKAGKTSSRRGSPTREAGPATSSTR